MKSQIQMYREAERKIADRNAAFVEIMQGPNPLTPEEVDALAEKDPARYGIFKGAYGTGAK